MPIHAITFDLDDTLWPFGPVARRIEDALRSWMAEHAPQAAARYDPASALEIVAAVRRERPDLAHRILDLRREALRRMLGLHGDDPELADAAMAVVLEARQQVDLYPEAASAMDRLAARYPLLALTNGNADLQRTGVAHWFGGIVSAEQAGVAKPDAQIFLLACARLGAEPADVLHVGDNLELDVHGALDAGLQAAWIHRGFDGDAPTGALGFHDLAALADALDERA